MLPAFIWPVPLGCFDETRAAHRNYQRLYLTRFTPLDAMQLDAFYSNAREPPLQQKRDQRKPDHHGTAT